jgi:uncharacterized membrane-anchored protein
MSSSRVATALPVPSESAVANFAIKVPEVTAYFWVIKVLSTAMGEALSDFLDGGAGLWPVFGVLAALIVFVVALRLQLKETHYVTAKYWSAVAMVATFGTMAADAPHQAFQIPYYVSAVVWSLVLTAIFIRWYRTEGTLSIHSINSRRRERYYWSTVLATFALGTAVGDMTATNFRWGFLTSGIVFAAIILIPAFAYWRLKLHSVFAFWFAYIITRPLGASFADWMDVRRPRGLGWGTGPVSLTLAVIMIAVIAFVGLTGRDVQDHVHVDEEPAAAS